jgi:hypothetical protein
VSWDGLHRRIDKETGLLGKVEYWNFVDWALNGPGIMKEVSAEFPLEESMTAIPLYFQCNSHMPHNVLQSFSDTIGQTEKADNIFRACPAINKSCL